jgi:predicted outer membrane repeat protein
MKPKFSAGIIVSIILSFFSKDALAWNQPPNAVLNVNPTVCLVGDTVTFDGSGSHDPDGSIVEYCWDLNGNGVFGDEGDYTETQSVNDGSFDGRHTYQYSTPGTYDVKLRVKDNANPGAYGYSGTIHVYVYKRGSTKLYVDGSVSSSGNGQGWTTAYKTLNEAISASTNGTTIYVAHGIYTPSSDNDREDSFALSHYYMTIIGGFSPDTGIEEEGQQDPVAYPTILSGEIQGDGVNTNNSYHILKGTMGAIVDGFTIKGGYAPDDYGAGMYNDEDCDLLEIKNCTFEDNLALCGGAIFNNEFDSVVHQTITKCIFINNSSVSGGAIYNFGGYAGSTATLQNCVFSQNTATDYGGGAIVNQTVDSTLTNCVFTGNIASGSDYPYGGAVWNYCYSNMTLTNCTFNNNTVDDEFGMGSGIYNGWTEYFPGDTSSLDIKNCIGCGFYPDSLDCVTNYSCNVGWPGTGNISGDPLFIDEDNPAGPDGKFFTSDDGLQLAGNSPCINKGKPDENYDNQTDLNGNRRVMGARVDMGAYEFEQTRIYVDKAVSPGGNGLSWSTAYNDLQFVLRNSYSGDIVWVADGYYTPTTDNNRDKSFILKQGVALYGGFNGDEAELEDRWYGWYDYWHYKTILSGDIDNDGLDSDNSRHVVKGADNAILDGFYIIGGYAEQSAVNDGGGGMQNYQVSPIVRNCIFLGNFAKNGGGMLNFSCHPQVINCIFSGNNGQEKGGGICNSQANPSIVNCTFSNNQSTNADGKQIYNLSTSAPGIINCIISGTNPLVSSNSDTYVSYSDIQGCGGSGNWNTSLGHDGGHNIDSIPLFFNAVGPDNTAGTLDDELLLQTGSPCKRTGIDGEDVGVNWPIDAIIQNSVSVSDEPTDLAVNSDGLLYVFTCDGNVKIYNSQLQLQNTITTLANGPFGGIAVDSEDNIYIADSHSDRILKYTSAGVLDTTFDDDGIVGSRGTGDGQFECPWGIAVGWDGNVYVTEFGSTDRVQVFDKKGKFVTKWGQPGSEPGELQDPEGFCLLGSNEMVLADFGNNRIQHFSASSGYLIQSVGQFGSHCGQFSDPMDVCYDINYDQLIVADTANSRLQIFQMHNFSDFGRGGIEFVKKIENFDTYFLDPIAVACAGSEAEQIIYVANAGSDQVFKIVIKHDQPGCTPLHTFESLKAALWSGDVDKSATFFDESVGNDYRTIFNEHSNGLQNMINNMGQMSLESQDEGMSVYEISDTAGTLSYPVVFTKDELGNRKIVAF